MNGQASIAPLIRAGGRLSARRNILRGKWTSVFDMLQAQNNLKGLDARVFSLRSAEYVNELKAIHPFLDENGHTNRGFSGEAGWPDRTCNGYGAP